MYKFRICVLAVLTWVIGWGSALAQDPADRELGGEQQAEIAGALAGLIRERYVLREEGENLARMLETSILDHGFDTRRTDAELSHYINGLLQNTFPDRHLGILTPARYLDMVAMFGEPEEAGAVETSASHHSGGGHGPTPSSDTATHRQRERAGQEALHDIAGITGVSEISRDGLNQLGYVSFDRLISSPRARAVVTSIMSTFTESDRIIIDLRECRGGDADMVRFLSGFFFAEPAHLVSTMMRDGTVSERWTTPNSLSPLLADMPLEILISEVSFSAAESLAFGLSRLGRARLLGQATGGGGHMNDFYPLPHDFGASISVERAFDPRTGQGWQARGVEPDVVFEPGHALSGTSMLITDESGRLDALAPQARPIYALLQAYTGAWYTADVEQMDASIATDFRAEYRSPSGLLARGRTAQLAATHAGTGVLLPLFHNRIIRDIRVEGDQATAQLILRETTHQISLAQTGAGWQITFDSYENKRSHG